RCPGILTTIGEGLVGQFLEGRQAVARQLLELGGGVVIEGDQFAHAFLAQSLGSVTCSSGTCGSGAGWIINGDAPMTRISAIVLIAAVTMASAPTASLAQGGA